MKTSKTHSNTNQEVVRASRMPEIKTPAAARHLAAFGFAREQDDRAKALACLVDFITTLAECEDPREKLALMKRFPQGVQSGSLLRLEFNGAGMGGCGAVDVGVLYNPSAGVELVCWLDLENGAGDVLASLVFTEELYLSAALIRLALKSLGAVAVANCALSGVENRIPRHISRKSFHRVWLEVSCGRWQHYHALTDTPDKLNYDKIEAIANSLSDIIRRCDACQFPPAGRTYDSTPTELLLMNRTLGPFLQKQGLPAPRSSASKVSRSSPLIQDFPTPPRNGGLHR